MNTIHSDEAKWSSINDLVRAYDEITFLTKMREKDTKVALANCSPMIKSIKFSLSLRK